MSTSAVLFGFGAASPRAQAATWVKVVVGVTLSRQVSTARSRRAVYGFCDGGTMVDADTADVPVADIASTAKMMTSSFMALMVRAAGSRPPRILNRTERRR